MVYMFQVHPLVCRLRIGCPHLLGNYAKLNFVGTCVPLLR